MARKPRVLYFITQYPNFSETYMHEEIRSISDQFDVAIITYLKSPMPRKEAFDYKLIRYTLPCFVYAPIERVDMDFSRPESVEFLKQIDEVIAEFKPDLMHAHYLGLVTLLDKLSEIHGIPYTVRTHSQDILKEPREKLETLCSIANRGRALGVLGFPPFRQRLQAHGLRDDLFVECWPVVNVKRFFRTETGSNTGKVMCAGPVIEKKSHHEFIELANAMRETGLQFDFYGDGFMLGEIGELNEKLGSPARILYADPNDMPGVYAQYDWLVYPASKEINRVGFPCAIVEAQASGLGVLWQRLPGREAEQLDFLGGGGILFDSIEEVPELLSRPYPQEMRENGWKACWRSDIEGHKNRLTDLWNRALKEKEQVSGAGWARQLLSKAMQVFRP
jgi:glycosyltransferase involved in cell wall biosynthesis